MCKPRTISCITAPVEKLESYLSSVCVSLRGHSLHGARKVHTLRYSGFLSSPVSEAVSMQQQGDFMAWYAGHWATNTAVHETSREEPRSSLCFLTLQLIVTAQTTQWESGIASRNKKTKCDWRFGF